MRLNGKKDAGLAALAVLLGGLAQMNSAPAVEGVTWCSELTNCRGNSGCQYGGNVSGCTISCTGGGTANCLWKSG